MLKLNTVFRFMMVVAVFICIASSAYSENREYIWDGFGSHDIIMGVQSTSDGNIIVTGCTWNGTTGWDLYVAMIDPEVESGWLVDEWTWDSGSQDAKGDIGHYIIETRDGDFIVVGVAQSSVEQNHYYMWEAGGLETVVIRLEWDATNQEFDYVWDYRYDFDGSGGTRISGANYVVEHSDDDNFFMICGIANDGNPSYLHAFLGKCYCPPNGFGKGFTIHSNAWVYTYQEPDFSDDPEDPERHISWFNRVFETTVRNPYLPEDAFLCVGTQDEGYPPGVVDGKIYLRWLQDDGTDFTPEYSFAVNPDIFHTGSTSWEHEVRGGTQDADGNYVISGSASYDDAAGHYQDAFLWKIPENYYSTQASDPDGMYYEEYGDTAVGTSNMARWVETYEGDEDIYYVFGGFCEGIYGLDNWMLWADGHCVEEDDETWSDGSNEDGRSFSLTVLEDEHGTTYSYMGGYTKTSGYSRDFHLVKVENTLP